MSEELTAYAKKRKRKKNMRNLLISVLVLALLGTAGYFALTRFFVCNTFSVQETSLYPAEDILSVCKVEDGTPLISVSKNEISSAVQEAFPYLVDVQVEFDLPDSIIVTFTEDFGELALEMGKELFSVDCELTVLAKESIDSTIPRIKLISENVSRCVVGEKLVFFDESVKNSLLHIIESLKQAEMFDKIQSINVGDKFDLRVEYLDRFEILLGEENDLDLKFGMVKEVIRDLAADATGRIDISDANTAYVKLEQGAT